MNTTALRHPKRRLAAMTGALCLFAAALAGAQVIAPVALPVIPATPGITPRPSIPGLNLPTLASQAPNLLPTPAAPGLAAIPPVPQPVPVSRARSVASGRADLPQAAWRMRDLAEYWNSREPGLGHVDSRTFPKGGRARWFVLERTEGDVRLRVTLREVEGGPRDSDYFDRRVIFERSGPGGTETFEANPDNPQEALTPGFLRELESWDAYMDGVQRSGQIAP